MPFPVIDEYDTFLNLIEQSGLSRDAYQEDLKELQRHREWIMWIDTILSIDVPQELGHVNERWELLCQARNFIADRWSYWEGRYETSKHSWWASKSKNAIDGTRGEGMTDRGRERFQDAGSAPYLYLKNRYKQRMETIDKSVVRLNKMMEMENTLLKRGAS